MSSIINLYKNNAELYNAISNDREFGDEAAVLVELCKQTPRNSLELFSGQANHSVHLEKMGVSAFAIDAADDMRQTSSIDSSNFYVLDIPTDLTKLCLQIRFDLIFAMRFCIGYLSPSELSIMLSRVRNVMSESGTLVIEIHNSLLPSGQFSSLAIQVRKSSSHRHGDIECRWPSGPIHWSDGNKAHMPVKIKYERPNPTELNFVSEEYIYTARDILEIGALEGWRGSVEKFTPYSDILVMTNNRQNARTDKFLRE